MKKRNINSDPPEHRPDPPPPPPVRGAPILARVIEDLKLLEKFKQVAERGRLAGELLRDYALLKGLTEKEIMDKIRGLKRK